MYKKLTICITTYNNCPFNRLLLDTIYSEFSNSNLDDSVDIIIIDDKSTCDEQLKVLEEYSMHFKVICNDYNYGTPSVARNKAINEANSEYILFIDGDDILLEPISKILDYLENEDSDIIVSDVIKVGIDGRESESPFVLSTQLFNDSYIGDIRKYTVHQTGIWSIYKVSFILENNLKYSTDCRYEDNLFMTELYLCNPKINLIPLKYYGWRTNHNGFSSSTNAIQNRIEIYDRILQVLSDNVENDATGYLLNSIYNQTYGNIVRNYPKTGLLQSTRIFYAYKKVTKKYSKQIKKIDKKETDFTIGSLFKYIDTPYENIVLMQLLRFRYYTKHKRGVFTKLIINIFYLFLPVQNKYFFTSHYGEYSDNSKYMYLKMKNDPKYKDAKFVFAVKDQELLENEDFIDYNNSLTFYYNFYTSKVIYFNTWTSPNLKKKRKQKFVQLWHGKPYKYVYTDTRMYDSYYSKEQHKQKETAILRWDEVYSVDDHNTKIFERLFPTVKVLQTEYPKVEWLLENKDNSDLISSIYNKYELDVNTTYTIYAPTYRPYRIIIDLLEVQKLVPARNKLIIHMHPLAKYEFLNKDRVRYKQFEQVEDMQELILTMSSLITDYSSIQYDFKKLNKEVYFYKFDIDSYSEIQGIY